MYRVFRLGPAHASKVDLLLKDDLVSRQSVIARDAKSLGFAGEDRYVLIEGTDAALARAVDLLKDAGKPLAGPEAEDVHRRVRAQEDDAASGMGLIFGP